MLYCAYTQLCGMGKPIPYIKGNKAKGVMCRLACTIKKAYNTLCTYYSITFNGACL